MKLANLKPNLNKGFVDESDSFCCDFSSTKQVHQYESENDEV